MAALQEIHAAHFPAQAPAEAGLSWLYSQLIHPHTPRKVYFSAVANLLTIVKHSRDFQLKLATQEPVGT